MESTSPLAVVARLAREAMASDDLDAARHAWRRLVRTEPSQLVWRLRLAELGVDAEERAAARAEIFEAALADDQPLAALVAALADPFADPPEDLVTRLAPWLAGADNLNENAALLPPGFIPGPVPPDTSVSLPPWPAGDPDAPRTPMPLLSLLDAAGLERVLGACSRRSLAEGEVLLAEGDTADALYLLVGGALTVSKLDAARGEVQLGSLRPGAVVGEMALVLDRPRSASVQASAESELLRVNLEALRAVAAAAPAVASALRDFTETRALGALLGTSPLFTDLDPAARAQVARHFEARDAVAHEILLQEGDAAAGLFLVVEGAVEVSRADGEGEALVARLGPGQVFGEIALVQGGGARATVVAQSDCRLRVLPAAVFAAVCAEHPGVRAASEALAEARVAENRFIFEDDEFIEAAD